jgi:hypothetical protein
MQLAHQNNYTQRLHYLTMKHVLEPEHVLCTDNTQVNIHVRLLHMTLHYLTIKHILETEHEFVWLLSVHLTSSVSRTCFIVR